MTTTDILKKSEPVVRARRARTDITISCGCGLVVKSAKEALDHAEASGHVLTLHGKVGLPERLVGMRVQEVRK